MERQTIIKKIHKILDQHSISEAYLFGSFARGEKYNDIDILISPPRGFTLLDLSRLAQEMEDALCIGVDVVTKGGLDPYIRKHILKEIVKL